MEIIGSLVGLIVILLVLIGIFFLCRELLCWYWKINRMIEIVDGIGTGITGIWKKLEETNQILRQIKDTASVPQSKQDGGSVGTARNAVCPYCKKVTRIEDSTPGSLQTCAHCKETFEIQ